MMHVSHWVNNNEQNDVTPLLKFSLQLNWSGQPVLANFKHPTE